ncbi:O-methyltransferase [Teladorsagia circumcincta]|uniref:O-methyltransferase n=1 Tax=Teladorsagia circumcincta TaxID=45464 RepID=A0A2G9V5T7_TELCI|nr:O-methyltransferase [Teladorsagia circumcincta]
MSRIHVRSGETIDRSLSNLAANEPNTFDFVFLDDFERESYLDDYEHAVRLLRSGGLLVINKALNNGGVLSGIEVMSDDDRAIASMNGRIKHDARVRTSLLPYGGGAWIIIKK